MWIPEQPLKEIDDEEVRNIFLEQAQYFLESLNAQRLIVKKTFGAENNGRGIVRYTESKNPEWYQELWERYSHNCRTVGRRRVNRIRQYKRKKPISPIGRREIINALERIITFEDRSPTTKNECPSNAYKNDARLKELIYQRLTQGHKENDEYIPPNKKVCDYFEIKINENHEDKNFREVSEFFEGKKT